MLVKQIEQFNLEEALGISDVSEEIRDEMLSKVMRVIETRMLAEIIKQLDEEGQEMLMNLFESKDTQKVRAFLSEVGIDLSVLLEKEVMKVKKEYAEKPQTV